MLYAGVQLSNIVVVSGCDVPNKRTLLPKLPMQLKEGDELLVTPPKEEKCSFGSQMFLTKTRGDDQSSNAKWATVITVAPERLGQS